MKKIKPNYIGIAIIVILAVGSIYLIKSSPSFSESISSFKSFVPEPYDDSNTSYSTDFDIIEDGLNNMGFLVTQEYYFTQIEEYTKTKKFDFKIAQAYSNASFSYSYDGKVEAGVDFTKISIEKDDADKKIIISVPSSEIHATTIDEDSFQLYNEDSKLWNRIEVQDFNNAQKEFKANAEKKAIQRGVLKKADEQARVVISNFVTQLIGTSDYTIEYK